VSARPPNPGHPRRPRRARRDDLFALVIAAITEEERSVAVEAITCAMTGNNVRIAPSRLRRTYEILEIVEVVAAELGAEVRVFAASDKVEVLPPVR
jgi:hypothetical protein